MPKRAKYSVIIESQEDNRRAKPILQEYAKKFKRNIRVYATHGTISSPITYDQAIHISQWASGVSHNRRGHIPKVFGIDLRGSQREAMAVTGDDLRKAGFIPLIDPRGVIYGEIPSHAPRNLNIHFDIFHDWNRETAKLLRHILDAYFSIISRDDLKEQETSVGQKALIEMQKNQYIKLCLERVSYELRELQEEIYQKGEEISKWNYSLEVSSQRLEGLKKEAGELCPASKETNAYILEQRQKEKKVLEERIKNIQKEVRSAEAKKGKLEAKLKKLSDGKDEYFSHELGKEYAMLRSSRFIKDLHFTDNSVTAITKTVILRGKEIGCFAINISENHARPRILNITQIIQGMHHPHGGGYDFCFGSAHDEIRRLMKNKQYLVAFHKIWSQLKKTSNSVSYWPNAKRRRKTN